MLDHYTYRVTWSAEDQEHVGLCAEFPSLSFLAASHAEALAGTRALVRDVLEDMGTSGEQAPAPFADRKYSGRFVVARGPCAPMHKNVAHPARLCCLLGLRRESRLSHVNDGPT